jgi:hypothetical protein
LKPAIIVLALIVPLGLAHGARASASAPQVVVSPLPGTPDASPDNQISFLGANASELHNVLVKGSSSATHSGKLDSYSSATGASFVPARPFQPGERVSVSATLGSGHAAQTLTTSFTVGSIYTLPNETGSSFSGHTPPTQRFHSRHDLSPPQIKITTPASDPALGDVLIAPNSGPTQAGPMIIEPSGQLVWFQAMAPGITAMNLRVQQYQGQPVLTWWQGRIIGGHGQGEDVIENSSYRRVATIHAGNGLYADLHEFQITPQGSALITAYEPIHADLSSVGGSRSGLLDDSVVQEIDIKTGLVMFEWHALGHVALGESYLNVPHVPAHVFDYFHLNTIQPQANGDLLISSRNTWTVYMISPAGQVLWQLGGKHSSFTLGPGVRFAWQHDSEVNSAGALSIFDNEDSPPEGSASRAIQVALDPQQKTATLLTSYVHPGPKILSPSQGNVQLLENQDDFVGWGQAGYVSEFSPSGQLTFDMQLPAPINSYRAYREPWSGRPTTAPALVAAPGHNDTVVAYCSWNGASEVSAWRLRTGRSPSSLKTVSTVPRQGFESELFARGSKLYLQVQALSPTGKVLGASHIVHA